MKDESIIINNIGLNFQTIYKVKNNDNVYGSNVKSRNYLEVDTV